MLSKPEGPLRLSPLLQAPTGQILEAVRKLGLEGVVGNWLSRGIKIAAEQPEPAQESLTDPVV